MVKYFCDFCYLMCCCYFTRCLIIEDIDSDSDDDYIINKYNSDDSTDSNDFILGKSKYD